MTTTEKRASLHPATYLGSMTQDNDKIDRKLERELASSTEEYCNTVFALTEQTERAEKAEAEVAFWKSRAYETEQSEGRHEAEVERLTGIANRAINALVAVTYGEESIDFEWPDIMRRVGELRNEFPFLRSTTEDSSAHQL